MKKIKDDELLDLVNEKDEVIGTVWKSEAHGNSKLIHREVAIAILNDKGEVLIQRRSLNKTSPGSWKITAAGHVGSGEDPKEAVKREVGEELGISINPIYFSKRFDKDNKHNESKFYWIYYALKKGRPKLKINTEEVMDALWIKPGDLVNFSKNNQWDIKGLSHKTISEIYENLLAQKIL